MTRAAAQRSLLATLCAGVVGCAGTQRAEQSDTNTPVVSYEFDATVIRANLDDSGEFASRIADMPSVFEEAGDYLVAGDAERAIELYELVIEYHDDDAYIRVSTYNRALALESLARWEEAAAGFLAVLSSWPSSEDAALAHLRLAENLALLERFADIPAVMERASRRTDLTFGAQLEVQLRWANAMLELRDYALADQHFREVLRPNEARRATYVAAEAPARDAPLAAHDALIAQANFGRGRVYHELFSEMKLVMPPERMQRDLADKTQLFEQAQEAYLDAVLTGDPYWAPAAGFMVGQLFEDYYFDILATEIPAHFGALELQIYWEELRAFLEPAMVRALRIYEQTLGMSYRLNARNIWVDDTLQSIHRVQSYLSERTNWAQEQSLIVSGAHPRSAHFADDLVFRSDDRSTATP